MLVTLVSKRFVLSSSYVMALPADDSARFDYLAEFLDTSDPIHAKFLQNFKLKSAERKSKSPVKNVKKSNISSAADLFGNPQEGSLYNFILD